MFNEKWRQNYVLNCYQKLPGDHRSKGTKFSIHMIVKLRFFIFRHFCQSLKPYWSTHAAASGLRRTREMNIFKHYPWNFILSPDFAKSSVFEFFWKSDKMVWKRTEQKLDEIGFSAENFYLIFRLLIKKILFKII